MKGFKKFIAGALSGALMFSAVPGVLAVSYDVIGTDIEEEAELLGALNIMIGDENGNFNPNNNIKRSEFAKIAVMSMGLGNLAETKAGTTAYPDVDNNHWASGFINVATTQKLFVGDENGNFRPDDNVNYAEAMTVFVRMLGHEPAALEKGTWPAGYLSTANQIGISKGISANSTYSPITRATAAKINFNSLTIDMMEQKGFGSNVHYEVVDKTLLEDVLGVAKATGQISANSHTKLNTPNGLNDGEVQIGENIYKAGNTNAENLLGYNVKYYYEKDDTVSKNKLIVARADSSKNSELEIYSANIKSSSATRANGKITLKYWVDKENDSSTKTITVEGDASLIYNGKAAQLSTQYLEPAFGKLVLLDTDSDNEYDVVHTTEYENYVVDDTSALSNTITDKYGKPSLVLDAESSDTKFSIEDKFGNKVKFEDISEWNVLSVTKSLDGKLIRVGVSTESVVGKVTAVSSNRVTIDGKKYEIAANYTKEINIDDEGTFYLDVENKIAAVDASTANSDNYAYLIAGATKGNIDNVVEFKLLDKNGELKVYEAENRVQLNNSYKNASAVLTSLMSNGSVERQLITFELSANNKISRINTASNNTANGGYNASFSKDYTGEDVVFKSASSKLGRYNVTDKTIIFEIPENETDPENYAVRTKSLLANDNKYNVEIFDITEDLKASVIIVTNTDTKTNNESSIAIVDEITRVQNDRGETVERISLMYGGEKVSYLGESSGIFKADGRTLKSGDIIQFKTNSRNEVYSVSLLLNIDNKSEEFSVTSDRMTTINGKVTKKFTGSINVSVNGSAEENYSLENVTIYKYDSDKARNKITVASAADISRYDSANPQTVFIRIYDHLVKEIVIVE